MAYTDSVRLVLKGDRAKAARYVNDARRLIFNLVRELREAGVLSGRRLHRFMDGTTVLVVVAGMQVVAEINTAPEEDKTVLLQDVVVWPRSEDFLIGIDEDNPELILNPPSPAGSWKTYFFSTATDGYDAFPGRKGTYSLALPDGIHHAGNIDWYNTRDEVISWYGPSSRYWPDAFVQPRAQYGKFVFMLGAVLLDTDQYASDSTEQAHDDDRYIMGAAIKQIEAERWLYTVQSEALDETTPAGPLYIDSMPTAGRPYTGQDNIGGVYRYALNREADEETGLTRYSVVANSRQKIADLPDNHAEPWFFNQSCTAAHCYELPPDGWLARIDFFDGGEQPVPDLPITTPNPVQVFREATFDDIGGCEMSTTNLSVPFDGTEVHFVADYKGDTRVFGYVSDLANVEFPGLEPFNGGVPNGPIGFRVAGKSWKQVINAGAHGIFPNPDGWLTGFLAFADLRRDVLVLHTFYTATVIFPLGTINDRAMEVYRDGVRVHTSRNMSPRPYSPGKNTGYGNLYYLFTGQTDLYTGIPQYTSVAPYFYLYGVALQPAWQGAVPGPDEFNLTSGAGFLATMAWSPYPEEAYFGYTCGHNTTGWELSMYAMGILAPGGFQGNAADFDGHLHVLSCAATEQFVFVSGYLPANFDQYAENYTPDGNRSFYFVTNGDFAELTSVTGEFARYHPIWRLGRPAGGTNITT